MNLAPFDEADRLLKLDGRHRYWLGSERVPGVTTIIKVMDAPALNRWMVKVEREACIAAAWKMMEREHGPEPSDEATFRAAFLEIAGAEYEGQKQGREAADAGKQLHALIEAYCKGKLGIPCPVPAVSDESQERFTSWLSWAKDTDLTPLSAERKIFSRSKHYAGTLDLLAMVVGKLTVLDWKSSGHYLEQELQSVAYRGAVQEMLSLPEPPDGLLVIVPRDGGAVRSERCSLPYEAGLRAFDACRALYDVQRAFRSE